MKSAPALLTPLLDAGAALVLDGALPDESMVLAKEHLLLDHELFFHVAFENLSRGLSSIPLDGLIAADDQHLELYRDGDRVATIQPVAELGQKAELIWHGWEQWCDAHYVEYYEEVTTRLRERDPEGV